MHLHYPIVHSENVSYKVYYIAIHLTAKVQIHFKSFILQFIGTYAEITKSQVVPPAETSRTSEDKLPHGTYADIEFLPTNSTLPPPAVGERVQYSRARRERQPLRARQQSVPGQVTNDSRLQGQEQSIIPEPEPTDLHPHPLG